MKTSLRLPSKYLSLFSIFEAAGTKTSWCAQKNSSSVFLRQLNIYFYVQFPLNIFYLELIFDEYIQLFCWHISLILLGLVILIHTHKLTLVSNLNLDIAMKTMSRFILSYLRFIFYLILFIFSLVLNSKTLMSCRQIQCKWFHHCPSGGTAPAGPWRLPLRR